MPVMPVLMSSNKGKQDGLRIGVQSGWRAQMAALLSHHEGCGGHCGTGGSLGEARAVDRLARGASMTAKLDKIELTLVYLIALLMAAPIAIVSTWLF